MTTDPTPIEERGDAWVKRDDFFEYAGVRGGKVRTCATLASTAHAGLVTAGSRSSPQVNIVAHVGRFLGIPVRAHCPSGPLLPEVLGAQMAGAEIVQHSPGYNSVIVARAHDDAVDRDWTEIPFGMECQEAVDATASQVVDIPDGVERIVVPVGSGMSMAGILTGLQVAGLKIPVLGVTVGADPMKRLNRWAPVWWAESATLVSSGSDYSSPATVTSWRGLTLDAHYEAKTIPFLRTGDLLWVVGIRQSAHESKWVCVQCGKSVPAGPVIPRAGSAEGYGPCYVCDEVTEWTA